MNLKQSRKRRARRQWMRYCILVILLVLVFFITLMLGTKNYSFLQVVSVFLGNAPRSLNYAVAELRLPRSTLAVFAGFSFGVAGVSFQTMLRNQLASPDIVGISYGASAAGVTAIVIFGWGQTAVSFFSLTAALITALSIYLLAYKGGFAGSRFILIGIGISSMLMSVVSYVLSKAAVWDLATATRWLTGSLNGATWELVLPIVICCLVVLPIIIVHNNRLYVLRFGDETAQSLGINVVATRIIVIVCAVLLIAVATSVCGPISFVAFMSGPVAARIATPSSNLTLLAGLVGALLVLVADFTGQYLLGTRYPVGVITGMLGAPFLIYLLAHTQRKGTTL